MERISPFSFSTQELLLGNEEKLSIFISIPGAFLGEWGAALHFHPKSFSRGMGSSSPFSLSSQELLFGNGEKLSIFLFIPGAFLGEWRAALHFYPRISRGMGSNSTFSLASQETFFLSRAALHLDIIHDLTK